MPSDHRPCFRVPALIVTAFAVSWLGMMVVHESGHVLAALATGGHVSRVVLHPLGLSRTDVLPNPSPIPVALAGSIWGTLFPLVLWAGILAINSPLAFLARLFAGFCLIANGAYLASAAFMPVGDSADLVRLGVPAWTLWLPGLAGLAGGLGVWNRLAPSFGIGPTLPDPRALPVCAGALALLIAGMSLWTALT